MKNTVSNDVYFSLIYDIIINTSGCPIYWTLQNKLKAYKVEFNYRNYAPEINQHTQSYQGFLSPPQVFTHTCGCEKHKKRNEVEAETVAELGETHGAMCNYGRQYTEDG